MIRNRTAVFAPAGIALLLAVAVAACTTSDEPSPIGGDGYKSIDRGRGDSESELAALWLSGERVAPSDLYQTIKSDLSDIRTAYLDSISEVDTEFRPPWVPSQIIVGFTEEGVRKLRTGEFPEFDELNDLFHLTELDTKLTSTTPRAVLTFAGNQHPQRLSDPYGELDDIVYAEPNGYMGDWSNVYPWRLADGMSYLWRDAWGDCPAGCINSRFWYFRVTELGIEYVGTFQYHVDPEPPWWSEAKVAFDQYRSGGP